MGVLVLLNDEIHAAREVIVSTLPVGQSNWLETGILARLQEDGLSRATIRSRWIALKSFYNWATSEDEIDDLVHLTMDEMKRAAEDIDRKSVV